MNQKTLITVLVVIIVILTGTTVYFGTNQAEQSTQPISEKEIEITKSKNTIPAMKNPAENTTESMDWQTYSENTTGFSIKYPNGWPVRQPAPNDCGENKICEVTFGDLPQGPDDQVAIQNLVNILVHSPGSIEGNGGDGYTNCINMQTVTLNNGLSTETKECPNDMDGSRQYFYTFKKDGWWYQIVSRKGSEATKVFDDMVNSFAFTK